MVGTDSDSGGAKNKKSEAMWTARGIALVIGAACWPSIHRDMVLRRMPHVFGMPVGDVDPDQVMPIFWASVIVALGISFFVDWILRFIYQVFTRQ